jgi:hypothetical protein
MASVMAAVQAAVIRASADPFTNGQLEHALLVGN